MGAERYDAAIVGAYNNLTGPPHQDARGFRLDLMPPEMAEIRRRCTIGRAPCGRGTGGQVGIDGAHGVVRESGSLGGASSEGGPPVW